MSMLSTACIIIVCYVISSVHLPWKQLKSCSFTVSCNKTQDVLEGPRFGISGASDEHSTMTSRCWCLHGAVPLLPCSTETTTSCSHAQGTCHACQHHYSMLLLLLQSMLMHDETCNQYEGQMVTPDSLIGAEQVMAYLKTYNLCRERPTA